MASGVLIRAAKIKGTRYPAGAVITGSDDDIRALVADGLVRAPLAAAPLVMPRRTQPRTPEAKGDSLREAQARVAVAMGTQR